MRDETVRLWLILLCLIIQGVLIFIIGDTYGAVAALLLVISIIVTAIGILARD